MSNKRFGCLAIGLILFFCISVMTILALVGFGGGKFRHVRPPSHAPEFEEQAVLDGSGETNDKIALIHLRGLISSGMSGSLGETMVDDLKIALRQATNDKLVRAIVLDIDSPGGEVTAADAIYNAVCKAREKKPVVVYMSSLAASGGYYVACGGTYLMANETTLTGSIGVIIQTLNYQQLFGKIGLDSVVFKSGKFKDMLSGSRPMTQEEKDYVQNLIMQTYGKFVGIVAAERKLPVEELRNGIADGRIISGKDALDYKLINQLGQIEDAFEKAKELGNAKGASVIKYEAPFRLGKALRLFGGSENTKVEVNLTGQILPKLESGRIYLLPSFYAP